MPKRLQGSPEIRNIGCYVQTLHGMLSKDWYLYNAPNTTFEATCRGKPRQSPQLRRWAASQISTIRAPFQPRRQSHCCAAQAVRPLLCSQVRFRQTTALNLHLCRALCLRRSPVRPAFSVLSCSVRFVASAVQHFVRGDGQRRLAFSQSLWRPRLNSTLGITTDL